MDQMGAAMGAIREHKPKTHTEQPETDIDNWLQEAWQANDTDAVQWFTHTIHTLQKSPTTEGSTRKPR